MDEVEHQPALHDLCTCLAAPTTILSARDGQIRPGGAQGVYVADIRAVSRADLRIAGERPELLTVAQDAPGSSEFVASLPRLGGGHPDPRFWVRRRRRAEPDGCVETITVTNAGDEPAEVVVDIALSADLAAMDVVKAGSGGHPRPLSVAGDGFALDTDGLAAIFTATGGATASTTDDGGRFRWRVTVPARDSATVEWSLRVDDRRAVVVACHGPMPFSPPTVRADDRRLPALVHSAVTDLAALMMSTADDPDGRFLAAGSPWYLTLFGRDSLWAARMLLPLGTDLARTTLAALAARQGRRTDRDTAEEPGKILHELRRGPAGWGATQLPPVYFGTVDASLLWICLLAEAWRWGLDPAEVVTLLPAADAALEWMAAFGDTDGDGFIEYVDRSGHGLANQGWKDSADAVRFSDGRIADGPVALAEVQGYAYQAAVAAAALFDEFGRPGADRWRDYAHELAARFRRHFWVADDLGPYPAMALDGEKRPVDAPASNIGHLLTSGLLDGEEARAVADRLVHPTMSSGFGLRTMATTTGGYSPLSYHCGSVWPHDTAIAIDGLVSAGFAAEAVHLAEGLLSAAAAFDYRPPELFAGFARDDVPTPVPYPAACRPQAWSSAAAVVVLRALLGLQADVPRGVLRLNPAARLGALHVSGLRVGSGTLAVHLDGDGAVTAGLTGIDLRIETPGPRPESAPAAPV